MACVTGSQAENARRMTDKFISERYTFDVVPCADHNQDRSNVDNETRIKSSEEAPSFIAWIVVKTGWTIQGVPPIRFVPYAELVKIYSGGKGTHYHVELLYSEEDHTIYLPDTWRADDLRDRSLLLHELVHHLQYLNSVKVTCATEHEWQALELQVTWLREQEVDNPVDLLGIDPHAFFLCFGNANNDDGDAGTLARRRMSLNAGGAGARPDHPISGHRALSASKAGCMPSLAAFTARADNNGCHQLRALGDYSTVGVRHLNTAGSVVSAGSRRAICGPSHNGSASGFFGATPA